MNTTSPLETLYLDDSQSALVIIDQTLLPNEIKYLALKTQAEIWEAIQQLRVRGAPAIGIAAAYALYLAVKQSQADSQPALWAQVQEASRYLSSARPTAVNLFWALERMERVVSAHPHRSPQQLIEQLREEADFIRAEDLHTNRAIGEHGLTLLKRGDGILTHCNAGALATAGYGTATAPLYLGQERGYAFKVFADETRPLLQGARLTSFELSRAGVDVTLICDNMAASVMQQGWVQAVLVGCDRVAANGDTANKIGTLAVAMIAHAFQIPFYVCAPTSTIDMDTPNGEAIPIELRNADEVYKKWYAKAMAPEKDVRVYNPAFDVTPARLITAFITEQGIARPPFDLTLKEVKSSQGS